MRHEIKTKNGKLIVRSIISILRPMMVDGKIRNVGDLIDMDDTDARELIASGRAELASNDELQHALYVGVAWHSIQSKSRLNAQRIKAKRRLSKNVLRLNELTLQDVQHATRL
jgi:hypothetical protein